VIAYEVEEWADIEAELTPLFASHWAEIAHDQDKIPLDVDYDRYRMIEPHIVTVRSDGKLVGYHISIITGHLHYKSTLFAFTDIFYLRPDYRKGMTGVKLFKEVENSLKGIGVVKMFTGTKTKIDIGPILKRQGFSVQEVVYSKVIG